MLGHRYTTPMVTVVGLCPVTSLHHMASLQSASSCNCTSYAGANLFKNQADLYWRVIYDPLRFVRNFVGGRPMDR